MTFDRPIGDRLEDTIASLDRLNAAGQARRAYFLDALKGVVAGLDGPPIADPEEPTTDQRRRDDDDRRRGDRDVERMGEREREARRALAGQDYGPAVRERLIRIALDRE